MAASSDCRVRSRGSIVLRPRIQRSIGALLGVSSLLFAAPAAGQNANGYEIPQQITKSPGGVIFQKLRYTMEAKDLSIGPFSLERSYFGGPGIGSSSVDGSALFGPNWTHNYSIYVAEGFSGKTDNTLVIMGRKTVHFTRDSSGATTCWNPDCYGETLQLANSGGQWYYIYINRDGDVYTFSPTAHAFSPYQGLRNQRVAQIAYTNGHTLTFSHSGDNLIQISSNYGYSLVFQYSGAKVSMACGYNRATAQVAAGASATCASAALKVSYFYATPSLSSVTDVSNQNWGYGYDSGNGQLNCVNQVASSTCLMSLSPGIPGVSALQQNFADGAVYSYNYTSESPDDPPAYRYSDGSYTGPGGDSVTAVFHAGINTDIVRNGKTTSLTWDGVELVGITAPESNKVSYFIDGRGNHSGDGWTPKGSSTMTVSRSSDFPASTAAECSTPFQKICNKPIAVRDYNGNQTDYTYDSTHGGVLTETAPAVNGVRPQTRYTYQARYAWVKNASGTTVQEAVPVYVVTRKSSCMKGSASGAGCALANDEIVTTYDYGATTGLNNLNLRGETVTGPVTVNGTLTSVTLRTCYGYDWQGNRISTTLPNANLGSCQ